MKRWVVRLLLRKVSRRLRNRSAGSAPSRSGAGSPLRELEQVLAAVWPKLDTPANRARVNGLVERLRAANRDR